MESTWRNYFLLFKIHLKSRAKKCHKKIAQDFLSCTYTNIHSLIFLPLLDIYFVHIHDRAFPSLLEKGDVTKQGNNLSSWSVALTDISIFYQCLYLHEKEMGYQPQHSTNNPKSFRPIILAILFVLYKQSKRKPWKWVSPLSGDWAFTTKHMYP